MVIWWGHHGHVETYLSNGPAGTGYIKHFQTTQYMWEYGHDRRYSTCRDGLDDIIQYEEVDTILPKPPKELELELLPFVESTKY